MATPTSATRHRPAAGLNPHRALLLESVALRHQITDARAQRNRRLLSLLGSVIKAEPARQFDLSLLKVDRNRKFHPTA